MRLFVTPFAPNVLRVQIIALEKGVSIESVDVSETQRGDYLTLNALGQVPSLELDDGSIITESRTICEFLDATSGEPHLFGTSPQDRARIGMWERRAEMLLFNPSVEYGHHMHPMFQGRLTQNPAWAKSLVPRAQRMVDVMSDQLERSQHLAGDDLSAADFTAVLGYFGLLAYGALPPSSSSAVQAWSQSMLRRPSMAPLHDAAKFLQSLDAQGVAV